MGLLGSPATFGRMMDFIMRFLSCITYQDDVLIHSKTHAEQLEQLQLCFDRIRAHGLKLNVKKCSFGQSDVPYLGFLLTPTGILPGKEKTEAIREAGPPKNIRQVREFTGLCNYFRASVPNFSGIAAPLNRLTRVGCGWSKGELPPDALKAFNLLKEKLLNPPTLAYPNPKLDYHLMVDASVGSETTAGGLGASLIQIDEKGIPRAIGFASRGLSKHEKNYTAYLLEMQAACFGIEHFDVYLRGRHFSLHTDHRPLEKLSTVHNRTLNRLQQKMLEYHFTIRYKPGKDNVVSDFLSRNPVSAVDVKKETLVDLQRRDGLIAKLLTDMRNGSDCAMFKRLKEKLVVKGDLLFFRKSSGKLAVFAPKDIIPDILQSAHNSLLGGHMGMYKCRERILEKYFWPNMNNDVKDHIRKCVECQRSKPHSRPLRVPLQPLEQPSEPNHRIHVDLFGPLTSSGKGKKYVMVITDAFTKYVELVALPSKEASVVSKAIYETWITRYSTPKEIVTDGGKEFCNKILDGLCDELKLLHKQTSPYHPECNAAVEVFNRTMRQFLQSAISAPYLDWEPLLPALRISYNTSVSKATLATPFSLVFGMRPNMPFFDLETAVSYDEGKQDLLQELRLVRKLAEDNNIKYRKEYAKYYDARFKTELRQLSLDDMIFVQNNYKTGANPKLQPLFVGPYEVTRIKDANVYYKKGSKIKVAHLNRVKKASLALPQLQPRQITRLQLDDFSDCTQPLQFPLEVTVQAELGQDAPSNLSYDEGSKQPGAMTTSEDKQADKREELLVNGRGHESMCSEIPEADWSTFQSPSFTQHRLRKESMLSDSSSDIDTEVIIERESSMRTEGQAGGADQAIMDTCELSHVYNDKPMITPMPARNKRKCVSPPERQPYPLRGRRLEGPMPEPVLPRFPLESAAYKKRSTASSIQDLDSIR